MCFCRYRNLMIVIKLLCGVYKYARYRIPLRIHGITFVYQLLIVFTLHNIQPSLQLCLPKEVPSKRSKKI